MIRMLLAVFSIAALAPTAPQQQFTAVIAIHDPTSGSWLQWLDGETVSRRTLVSRWDAAVAPAPGGQIRVGISDDGNGYYLDDYARDGRRSFVVHGPPGGPVSRMTVAASGATYVVLRGSLSGGEGLWRNLPDGTYDRPIGTIDALREPRDLDLATDQCTLVAIEDHRVRRFNVCTERYEEDFTIAEDAHALRILPGGGVLLAAGDRLFRYDPAGTLVRTYEPGRGAMGPLALADGGHTVWFGAGLEVIEMDLATGAIRSIVPLTHRAVAIVPDRVWTAALNPATPRRRAVAPR